MPNPPRNSSTRAHPDKRQQDQRKLNVPNALCVIRLAAAGVMVYFAVTGSSVAFLSALIVALASDWLDGKLATLLGQETSFGARLDSVADASMYLALLIGAILLKSEIVLGELPWIGMAIASHVASLLYALRKFGQWPSYHTWSAKLSWWFVALGAIALFAGWALWPFRLAMIAVVLTNIEAICITHVLTEWSADVRSLAEAKAGRNVQP